MKVLLVLGTRPHFMKAAPLLAELRKKGIDFVLVHTGQHYDYEMSEVFLKEFNFPQIKYNLEVGSGTHGVQTGKMMAALDSVLLKEKPDVVLVMGDTNTTLAGALCAYKLHFPVGHIESGMREGIWRPEELNKIVSDHAADYCFCSTQKGVENCLKENIPREKVFFSGDLTYDAFLLYSPKAKQLRYSEKIGVKKPFFLLEVHRAETVDNEKDLKEVVDALLSLKERVVFTIHPRTKKNLEKFGLLAKLQAAKNFTLLPPLGYFEFLSLLLDSDVVLTDSSGIIKESFYAGKPCVTLDDTTEYPEIFKLGYNLLAGKKKTNILAAIEKMKGKKLAAPEKGPFGDGHAAEKIVDAITGKK